MVDDKAIERLKLRVRAGTTETLVEDVVRWTIRGNLRLFSIASLWFDYDPTDPDNNGWVLSCWTRNYPGGQAFVRRLKEPVRGLTDALVVTTGGVAEEGLLQVNFLTSADRDRVIHTSGMGWQDNYLLSRRELQDAWLVLAYLNALPVERSGAV